MILKAGFSKTKQNTNLLVKSSSALFLSHLGRIFILFFFVSSSKDFYAVLMQ